MCLALLFDFIMLFRVYCTMYVYFYNFLVYTLLCYSVIIVKLALDINCINCVMRKSVKHTFGIRLPISHTT